MLVSIQTSMGRLAHVAESAPRLAALPELDRLVLVDWSCPQGSGARFAALVGERARVVSVRDQTWFHKSRAQNVGARAAYELGATRLVFVDADTLCAPELGAFVAEHCRLGRFVVAGRVGGCDVPGLSGFVACTVEDFARAGGFDECCEGYAGEEFTFRLALYLRARADYVRTPPGMLRALPHSNALRVRHYEEKRLHRSHAANMRRLDAVLTECTEREGWQDLLFLAPKPRAR